MKTNSKNTVKSELQYYQEISKYSSKDLSVTRRFLKLMFIISSEAFMFSAGLALGIIPFLIIVNSCTDKGMWAVMQIVSVLLFVYPFIYHFGMRGKVRELRQEAVNAKNAYDTVIKEKSQTPE